MQSNLSLVRESLAREVWLATIMVRRPWRGRQTASRADRELSLTWRMLQKNDIRERLAKRPVGVVTGSSRADSHNFLPVRRSGLSEPRSRYAVLLHLEVQGLVVGSEVSGRCAPVSPGGLERLTDRRHPPRPPQRSPLERGRPALVGPGVQSPGTRHWRKATCAPAQSRLKRGRRPGE